MRYTSFILSFLFLALSLLPCTDGQELLDDIHVEHHDHEGTSHDHQGSCPPFCSCQCCGVVLTITQVEPQSFPVFKPVFLTDFYYSFSYSYHHPTIIWEPPTMA